MGYVLSLNYTVVGICLWVFSVSFQYGGPIQGVPHLNPTTEIGSSNAVIKQV